MKRIVFIVASDMTAMNFYRGYLRYLRNSGWEVSVIAKSNGDFEGWAASEGAVPYHVDINRDVSLWQDVRALTHLYNILQEIQPEVVVSATPKGGLLGTLAAKLARVPVRIYQLWGLRLEGETGMRRRVLSILERLSICMSTQCVANSASLARAAEEAGVAAPGTIKVLGRGSSHGVDLTRFSPGQSTLPSKFNDLYSQRKGLVVAFVGRLHKDKGIDTLISALALVRAQGTHISAVLIGAEEDAEIGDMIRSAPEYIHAVGRVADVRPFIESADVLCLPTLREGFPNVVLEAAALNVPAIVTDATGAIDSVVSGKTGWIFPVGDVKQLASILTDLSIDPALVERRGTRAREWVEKNFEQSKIWDLQRHNIEEQHQLALYSE